jgi:hypothetical protein
MAIIAATTTARWGKIGAVIHDDVHPSVLVDLQRQGEVAHAELLGGQQRGQDPHPHGVSQHASRVPSWRACSLGS